MKEEILVSVLLFIEDSEEEIVLQSIENISQQTHKNIDLIVSSFSETVPDNIKKVCSEKFLNVRWINHSAGSNFINETLKMAEGEIVFYKTINNVAWYPRHIQSHIEQFNKDPKAKWSLSHLENRDLSKINHPFNILSYRVSNPPPIKDICIDEVCHRSDINCEWQSCLVNEEQGIMFYAGLILKQWNDQNHRGCIPSEITVIQWVERENNSKINKEKKQELEKNISLSIGKPESIDSNEDETLMNDDGEIIIKRKLPTIVGNVNFEKHNKDTYPLIEPSEIKSIGVKRTMGVGDVVVCEPIIKKLREGYPHAEINFYTNCDDVIEYFVSKPDNTMIIPQNDILKDFLSSTKNDLKIDLDLSYESRIGSSFIDAYAEVANVTFSNDEEKKPQLTIDEDRLIEEKYVVVCGDGSGWPGKTWPISSYEEVITYLLDNNYKVIETGAHHTDLTPSKYHSCDFDEMVNLIAYCDFYIGADNGPMHIARAFNKTSVILNGSALTYITNPNKEDIYYLQNKDHKSLGEKHNMFFNIRPDGKGITFMPMSENVDNHAGIRDITSDHVIDVLKKLQDVNHKYDLFNNNVENINDMVSFSDNNGVTVISDHNKKDNDKDILYFKNNLFYIKNDLGFVERNRPSYHIEQKQQSPIENYINNSDYFIESNADIISDIKENISKDSNILDVGFGSGYLMKELIQDGYDNVRGYDISRISLSAFNSIIGDESDRVELKDVTGNIDEENNDVIVVNNLMSYVSDFEMLFNNIDKLLKKDGMMYFKDIFNNSDYSVLRELNIIRYFDKDFLEKFIENRGYTIKTQKTNNNNIFIKAIKND